MKHWTPKEEKELAEIYPTMSNAELAQHFGCTEGAVQVRGYRLGLHKDAAHNAVARARERRQTKAGFEPMKRRDGSSLDCTVEIINGIRITRAKTILDPRYTPTGPYVGAITGQVRQA